MGIENLTGLGSGVSRKRGNSETLRRRREKVFGKARHSIKVVASAEEVPSPEIMEQALNSGCDVDLIVGPGADRGTLSSLASRGVSVYELEEPPFALFAIVDGNHIIVKDPLRPERKQEQVIMYEVSLPVMLEREHQFDSIKSQARAL